MKKRERGSIIIHVRRMLANRNAEEKKKCTEKSKRGKKLKSEKKICEKGKLKKIIKKRLSMKTRYQGEEDHYKAN